MFSLQFYAKSMSNFAFQKKQVQLMLIALIFKYQLLNIENFVICYRLCYIIHILKVHIVAKCKMYSNRQQSQIPTECYSNSLNRVHCYYTIKYVVFVLVCFFFFFLWFIVHQNIQMQPAYYSKQPILLNEKKLTICIGKMVTKFNNLYKPIFFCTSLLPIGIFVIGLVSKFETTTTTMLKPSLNWC